MIHPLVRLAASSAHTHALLVKLEVGEHVPQLLGLHTELFHLADVGTFILDQAVGNLLGHTRVAIGHEETDVFIFDVDHGVVFPAFTLLTYRHNLLAHCCLE